MEVDRFFVANGMSELRNPGDGYESPYSDMDGNDDDDTFSVEYSNASGKLPVLKRNILKRPVLKQKPRLVNRPIPKRAPSSAPKKRKKGGIVQGIRRAVQSATSPQAQRKRQANRDRRLGIKEQQAATQRKVAASLSEPDTATAAILQQLNTPAPASATPATGMSKNMKIGLIATGIVVLAIVAVVVVKKMNKK